MNRENLEKLASYLEELPEDYNHFGMDWYFTIDDNWYFPEKATNFTCGTVACAVGHGPAAGLPGYKGEDWDSYSERVFQLPYLEWCWCFSGHWSEVDNTPHGAAKRIRYLMAHGLPENATAQEAGEAPYLFAKVAT